MLEILQIKAMEDSNLKWILLGFAMGWSAILKGSNSVRHVVGFNKNGMIILNTGSTVAEWNVEKFEITGYKYAGELAGSEAIPVGQRFLDQAGDILTFKAQLKNNVVRLENDKGIVYEYCKNEITPVFNI